MATEITREEIREALNELGNSSKLIAHNLIDKGIFGVPQECEACPLANYLYRYFGGVFVAISLSRIVVGETEIPTTLACRRFITEFDNRLWPEIVAKSYE